MVPLEPVEINPEKINRMRELSKELYKKQIRRLYKHELINIKNILKEEGYT